MNKNKLSVFLFASLFTFLYLGCSGSDYVQRQDHIPANKIIGSWKTDYNLNSKRGIITFKASGDFEDSLMDIMPVTLKLVPELVVKGKFFIEGPIIKLKDVTFIYPDFRKTDSVNTFYKYADNLSAFFEGETLFMQPVIEFEPAGSFEPTLAGKWITSRWVYTYNKNLVPQMNNGYVKETYEFDPVKEKCRVSKIYLFNNSPADLNTEFDYSLKERELTFGDHEKKWIAFYNNKMYWFNLNYFKYIKLN